MTDANGKEHQKTCTRCKIVKPLEKFHRFGKNGNRVGKWCEECYQKDRASSLGVP